MNVWQLNMTKAHMVFHSCKGPRSCSILCIGDCTCLCYWAGSLLWYSFNYLCFFKWFNYSVCLFQLLKKLSWMIKSNLAWLRLQTFECLQKFSQVLTRKATLVHVKKLKRKQSFLISAHGIQKYLVGILFTTSNKTVENKFQNKTILCAPVCCVVSFLLIFIFLSFIFRRTYPFSQSINIDIQAPTHSFSLH